MRKLEDYIFLLNKNDIYNKINTFFLILDNIKIDNYDNFNHFIKDFESIFNKFLNYQNTKKQFIILFFYSNKLEQTFIFNLNNLEISFINFYNINSFEIYNFILNRIIPINTDNIVIDPKFNENEYKKLKELLFKIIEEGLRNFKTTQIMSFKWIKNILRFFDFFNNEQNKNFIKNLLDKNEFLEISCFINDIIQKSKENEIIEKININFYLIGSSPTLDNDIEFLKGIYKKKINISNYFYEKDNYLNIPFIFSIDNAFFTLIRNNIIPDFVITLDPAPFVKLFTIKKQFKNTKTRLISPISVYPNIFKNYNKIILYNPGIDFDDEIFNFLFENINNSSNYKIEPFRKIDENSFVNYNIKDFLNSLFPINLNITNVGSASLKLIYILFSNLAKFLSYDYKLNFEIKTFGIDYSFKSYKYYSKESFLQKYFRINENYINTTIKNNIKKTINQKEKKLFEFYKKEFFDELNNINGKLKGKKFEQINLINNKSTIFVPLFSYFKLIKNKNNIKDDSDIKSSMFYYIKKIINNIFKNE